MTYADVVLHRVFLMPVTTGAHALCVNPHNSRNLRNPHTESLVLVICNGNPRRKYVHSGMRIVRPLDASCVGMLINIEEQPFTCD